GATERRAERRGERQGERPAEREAEREGERQPEPEAEPVAERGAERVRFGQRSSVVPTATAQSDTCGACQRHGSPVGAAPAASGDTTSSSYASPRVSTATA